MTWTDVKIRQPMSTGNYRVIIGNEKTTAFCEVLFEGTICRWSRHGIYEDKVEAWMPLPEPYGTE